MNMPGEERGDSALTPGSAMKVIQARVMKISLRYRSLDALVYKTIRFSG